MTDPLTTLLPAITLVLGIAGTLATESLRDGRHRKNAEYERRAARATALEDRRETFELENLNATYTALVSLGRAAMRHHLFDLEVAEETGKDYASAPIRFGPDDEDLARELQLANRGATANIRLLLDDRLRASAERATVSLIEVGVGAKSAEHADAEMASATTLLGETLRGIAERIRTIYAENSVAAIELSNRARP